MVGFEGMGQAQGSREVVLEPRLFLEVEVGIREVLLEALAGGEAAGRELVHEEVMEGGQEAVEEEATARLDQRLLQVCEEGLAVGGMDGVEWAAVHNLLQTHDQALHVAQEDVARDVGRRQLLPVGGADEQAAQQVVLQLHGAIHAEAAVACAAHSREEVHADLHVGHELGGVVLRVHLRNDGLVDRRRQGLLRETQAQATELALALHLSRVDEVVHVHRERLLVRQQTAAERSLDRRVIEVHAGGTWHSASGEEGLQIPCAVVVEEHLLHEARGRHEVEGDDLLPGMASWLAAVTRQLVEPAEVHGARLLQQLRVRVLQRGDQLDGAEASRIRVTLDHGGQREADGRPPSHARPVAAAARQVYPAVLVEERVRVALVEEVHMAEGCVEGGTVAAQHCVGLLPLVYWHVSLDHLLVREDACLLSAQLHTRQCGEEHPVPGEHVRQQLHDRELLLLGHDELEQHQVVGLDEALEAAAECRHGGGRPAVPEQLHGGLAADLCRVPLRRPHEL
mmetsp:Transcript_18212/g.70391  ORF Transcript_18212/g.70391 Transcript_18212/m.70391 type:complete len:510 (-) Transcript_18212:1355-2884(-)